MGKYPRLLSLWWVATHRSRCKFWTLLPRSLEMFSKTDTEKIQDRGTIKCELVGSWTNPLSKICASQIGSFPQGSGWTLKKCPKPPPSGKLLCWGVVWEFNSFQLCERYCRLRTPNVLRSLISYSSQLATYHNVGMGKPPWLCTHFCRLCRKLLHIVLHSHLFWGNKHVEGRHWSV